MWQWGQQGSDGNGGGRRAKRCGRRDRLSCVPSPRCPACNASRSLETRMVKGRTDTDGGTAPHVQRSAVSIIARRAYHGMSDGDMGSAASDHPLVHPQHLQASTTPHCTERGCHASSSSRPPCHETLLPSQNVPPPPTLPRVSSHSPPLALYPCIPQLSLTARSIKSITTFSLAPSPCRSLSTPNGLIPFPPAPGPLPSRGGHPPRRLLPPPSAR